MRLLNVDTFTLDIFDVAHAPNYAILSHTWGKDSEEVSYDDVSAGRLARAETRPNKVSGCCKQAKKDGYKYVWIDTCCINKTDSVELQEAINSMFRWYQKAQICYAFLSDVPPGADPHDPQSEFFSSRWFRRGWTLQELLAQPNVRFYDSVWSHLGTKGDLSDAIENITGIPSLFLLGITELCYASVAQRMSWAAGRVTKREEDIAYCLLGIFGVIIPGGILAAGPWDFANCGQIASRERPANDYFDLRGGNLRLRLFLYITPAGETLGLLNCGPEHDTHKVVGIPLATTSGGQPGEYMRPKGRYTALIPKPTSEVSAKVVRIRVDCERKPSAALSQPCFLHVQKTVRSLELIDVEPPSRWHKERALVEVATGPDSDCMQRILTRLREKTNYSADFIVVLELQSSEMKARCHVLIASRQTSLQDIARKFGDMRPEALGKQSATNGILNLHVTLEPVSKQRRLLLRLAASHNSPATTVNATLELHCLQRMVEIQCIEEAEGKKAREAKELNQKLGEKGAALGQTEKELRRVNEQLRRLREREILLLEELEDGMHKMNELDNKQQKISQQREEMSAWRSKAQQSVDRLWNSRPSAGEIGDKSVAEGDQALHFAAENGYEDVARLLLDKGADITAKDNDGWTPLHYAARYGHEAVTRLLLDKGADITAKDNNGWTPLHCAARYGHKAVTWLLLDKGADITAKDNNSWTPLHVAASYGHNAVTRLLLDRGADITAKDNNGRVPLDAAANYGHEKVVRLFLDRGANIAAQDVVG
ncbi:hypothetical protein DL769_004113 [Monosporascus sp. CRB-8-3]|nr:hypothetical protein DL769_004113 [Monosporascus sp. CRB-8-3]